jgi:membrane protein DedA with SNARE-associated domain
MEHVFEWVQTYGYAALYMLLMLGIVGLPIPDETLLVFCGYLISKGTLKAAPTLLTALAGSATGITLSYIIGRTLGLGVVHKYGKYIHVTEERLDYVHKWFDRIGHWALMGGYFVAGVRHLTAITAGTSKLSYRSFALFAYSGALLWASLFLTLGYFFGEKWQMIAETMHEYLLWISIAVLLAVAVYLLIRWQKSRITKTS